MKISPPWLAPILTAILAALALAAAVTLEALGDDATHAWEAFAGLVVFFGGIHVPAPTS